MTRSNLPSVLDYGDYEAVNVIVTTVLSPGYPTSDSSMLRRPPIGL